jgi:Ca2+/Na+ antiporter
LTKWRDKNWWLGRTAEQQRVRSDAKKEISTALSGRTLLSIAGIAFVYLAMALWLHPGNTGDSVFFALTLGPLLTGAVLPRRSDTDESRQFKRTVSTVLAVSLVVMMLTLSVATATLVGVVLGLVLAGYYQLFSSINDAGRYARRRLDEQE